MEIVSNAMNGELVLDDEEEDHIKPVDEKFGTMTQNQSSLQTLKPFERLEAFGKLVSERALKVKEIVSGIPNNESVM
jgi:hypothetical protein